MKPWERIFITLVFCLTILVAVWLHGILNRYEVIVSDTGESAPVTRYDRITGRIWRISGMGELREISGFDQNGKTWPQIR